MAFFASLFAYLASVAGIVLAFALSYSALFATPPDQPPIAPKTIAATVGPSAPQAALKAADSVPQFRAGQWGPAVVHSVTEGAIAGPAKAAIAVRHNALGTKIVSREQHQQPLDLRAYTKLWAYQPAPRLLNGGLGYAEEPSDQSRRTW
jgi:hypothetical protein